MKDLNFSDSERSGTPQERLTILIASLRDQCDMISDRIASTDRQIGDVDQVIQTARHLGVLTRQAIFGSIAERQPFDIDSPEECFQLIQPAVTSDHGCSVVLWSAEDYADWRDGSCDSREALDRCKPLRDCPAAIRVAMIKHVPELLETLMRGLMTSRELQ